MASSKKSTDTRTTTTSPGAQDPAASVSLQKASDPSPSTAAEAAQSGPAESRSAQMGGEAGVVGFDAFVAGNEAILDTIAALNSEVTAFGSQRLDANLRHRDCLLDCRSAEEAFRLQSDFISAAAHDYLEQSNHVMKIMSDMTLNCWNACEKQSKEILANLEKVSRS